MRDVRENPYERRARAARFKMEIVRPVLAGDSQTIAWARIEKIAGLMPE